MELIEESARHGYQVRPGTLYPILRDPERAGYLSCERRAVNDKMRKHYRITAAGQDALVRLCPKIWELVDEVLDAEPEAAGQVETVAERVE